MTSPVRIAMWSGPRNISTAMMRSWENRPDCSVTDEPLYAYYLAATGIDHPGRDQILASQPNDWQSVAQFLTSPAPGNSSVWYQKHIATHLLPDVSRDWIWGLTNAFLIRDPAEMALSYEKKRAEMTPADLGLDVQAELFDELRARTGKAPPVILGRDVLRNPKAALTSLCAALEVPFDEAMLSWPAGRRDSDGVWADHWYDAVEASTGFGPEPPPPPALPGHLRDIVAACRPAFEHLAAHRLHP